MRYLRRRRCGEGAIGHRQFPGVFLMLGQAGGDDVAGTPRGVVAGELPRRSRRSQIPSDRSRADKAQLHDMAGLYLVAAAAACLSLLCSAQGVQAREVATRGSFFDPRRCWAINQQPDERRETNATIGRLARHKFAFVLAHDLHIPVNVTQLRTFIAHIRHFHTPDMADIVFLRPVGSDPGAEVRGCLQEAGVRTAERAFPRLSQSIHRWNTERRNCCSWREYLKLAAWTLVEYQAVILLDTDQVVLGDLSDAFQCAEAGIVLYTSGPLSPFNGGFIALKPLMPIYEEMALLLSAGGFEPSSGFNGAGFGRRGWFRDQPAKAQPARVHYGAEGPQGFLYHYFVQLAATNSRLARAAEVDRCVWNYQKEALAKGRSRHPCSSYRQAPLLVHKADRSVRPLLQMVQAKIQSMPSP